MQLCVVIECLCLYQPQQVDMCQSIAKLVFGGLSRGTKGVNNITQTRLRDVGWSLETPLPCSCFSGKNNGLIVAYMSYVL